jgi:hypothetical protein
MSDDVCFGKMPIRKNIEFEDSYNSWVIHQWNRIIVGLDKNDKLLKKKITLKDMIGEN